MECSVLENENVCRFPFQVSLQQYYRLCLRFQDKSFVCACDTKRQRAGEREEEGEKMSDGAITQPFGTDILFSSQTGSDVSVPLMLLPC